MNLKFFICRRKKLSNLIIRDFVRGGDVICVIVKNNYMA